MKISALRLHNVKRFAGRGIAIEGIGDGVNVLSAANEFGKSTSFEALHALFFLPYASTAGDVRNLRPYSGGNPLVEADIATAQGQYRITKQFYGGRSALVADLVTGRITAQADEAENFIADLIHGGAGGPAGMLWVRQGMTGMEKRSRSEEESEKQIRAGLLESVQGEVEAVTGGRRMAEIMAAVAEARSALVTPTGLAKAGGRFSAALQERDRLASEEQRLAADVAALRAALDTRSSAMKRLAELTIADDREARRQAIESAQTAFDAARAQTDRLKTADAELNLARERRDNAHRERQEFRSAMNEARELQEATQAVNGQRAEILDKRRRANEAIDAAKAKAEAAEIAEQDARDLLKLLHAAAKARETLDRLTELNERLGQAETTRQALEENEAQFTQVTIPPGAIDELANLEIEITSLRAVRDARRPSVVVAYENGGPDRVTIDGMPLNDGEECAYDGDAQMLAPGIGTITLRSNRPMEDDGLLEQAEAKRNNLLASMGVEDLAGARKQLVQSQQLSGLIRELRAQLALLAPQGLSQLREEIAALGTPDTDFLELKADPVLTQAELEKLEDQRREARQTLLEIEPQRENVEDAFVKVEAELATLHDRSQRVEAVLGVPGEREQHGQSLSDCCDELDRSFTLADSQVTEMRAAAVDLESVEAALKRAQSIEQAVETEINQLRETIAGLNAQIRTQSAEAVEEIWRETADALAAAEGRVATFQREVAVLQRLSAALDAARSEARDLYLKPVMAELRPLLGLLFDDVSITFDDRTLLPQSIMRNGLTEEVDRLSGGMREQLSILTRLAFARLLANDGRPAPVILDDALVYSDDDRIEKMFDALHRQSRDQQIIVFSCRQRAFQRLGGNILQMTDWQP